MHPGYLTRDAWVAVTAGASTGAHQVFVVSDSEARAPSILMSDLLGSPLAFVKTLDR